MDDVTQKSLREAFPHGAAAFYGEDRPVIDIVDLEVRVDGDQVLARGWSYPNKDFIFDLTSPQETDHGWWVKDYDGTKVFLSPLSPARGSQMRDMLKEY